MSLHDHGEVGKPVHRNLHFGQTRGSISSLNEAWLHTLDTCVSDGPLNEVILPLMRNCFFWRRDARGFLIAEGSW